MRPEITHNVINQSSRDGKQPLLIVVHTTEGHNRPGLSDLRGLASWFDNPSANASSHVGNDGEGHDSRMVPDKRKAWTQASYNPVSLSIEQIGFASTRRSEWFKRYHRQLVNTAEWIAFWSDKYDIPIRRAITVGGAVVRSGVASHKQLGLMGGAHHDPGTPYPMRYVLLLARYFRLKKRRPQSKDFKKVRKRVNRIRRHYGLQQL